MSELTAGPEGWGSWLKRALQLHPGRILAIIIGVALMAAALTLTLVDGSTATYWIIGAGGIACFLIGALLPYIERVRVGPIEVEQRRLGEQAATAAEEAEDVGEGGEVDLDSIDANFLGFARYLAAESAFNDLLRVDHLGDTTEFHLYLWDADADRLLPVFEADVADEAASEGWERGQGVTGEAWASEQYVFATGEECWRGHGIPAHRQHHYQDLAVVAAMPVRNASGTVIAVLSASSKTEGSALVDPDGYSVHSALAAASARILVDLLGWFADE
jgi:hypothetical protein